MQSSNCSMLMQNFHGPLEARAPEFYSGYPPLDGTANNNCRYLKYGEVNVQSKPFLISFIKISNYKCLPNNQGSRFSLISILFPLFNIGPGQILHIKVITIHGYLNIFSPIWAQCALFPTWKMKTNNSIMGIICFLASSFGILWNWLNEGAKTNQFPDASLIASSIGRIP